MLYISFLMVESLKLFLCKNEIIYIKLVALIIYN